MKKPTIEDVPCYQCICLALCRRKDMLEIEKHCSLLADYYKAEPNGISNGFDFLKWSYVIKILRESYKE